jgi:CheY-like chemotaxis protein
MTDPVKVIDLKTSARAKILVAEDEKDIASLIEDWLSEVYDVTVALDGKTAVQKAVWHQPQVILLDVVLPDMSGYDVVRLLQGAAQTRGIPVIVMTAKNFDDSTIKMIKLENNVFGFLNKPFKPSDLIKMLEVVLKGGRSFLPEVGAVPAPVLPSPGKAQEPLPNAGADVVKDVSGPVEDSFPPSRATEELVLSSEPIGLVAESRADSGESPDRVSPKVRKKDGPAREKGEGTPSPEPPGNLKRIFLGCLVIFFILGLVLGVGEWTCRQVERDLGRRYFTPPLFPSHQL